MIEYDPMADPTLKKIVIPVALVAPFMEEVDSAGVQMVWDTFVKPAQDRGDPQSIEDRYLIAILHAMFAGLDSPLRDVAKADMNAAAAKIAELQSLAAKHDRGRGKCVCELCAALATTGQEKP